MFEHIDGFLASGTFIEKFQTLQVEQQGFQWRGLFPERLQQAWRKFPPEDRGGLQQTLVCLWQPIYARAEDPLNRVWYDDSRRESLLFNDGTGQFLQEEGIAFRLLDNAVCQRRRQCRVVTGGVHYGHTVLWSQTAQGQLGGVGLVDPRRMIARAIRRQEQDGGTGQTLDE